MIATPIELVLARAGKARKKVTLLVGDPGLGKSYLSLYCASQVSTGGEWPDGGKPERGHVILLTAEDGLADTVRPRVDALGGDVTRISVVDGIQLRGQDGERPFSLAKDCERLEGEIRRTGAKLVIVDPINAYLGGIDSHKAAEVRGIMAPLAHVAERTGAAVLMIHHPNKGSSANVLYRAGGSLDFMAAVRCALGVAPDPEQDGRVLLLPLKLNIGRESEGLGFRVTDHGIEWDGQPVTVNASEAFACGPASREERSALGEAEDFLRTTLANGPVATTSVKEEARQLDISEMTLKRAQKSLSVKSKKNGYSGSTHWVLSLPDAPADTSTPGAKSIKGVTSESWSPSEGSDPLRGGSVPQNPSCTTKETKGIISETWSTSGALDPLPSANSGNEPWRILI